MVGGYHLTKYLSQGGECFGFWFETRRSAYCSQAFRWDKQSTNRYLHSPSGLGNTFLLRKVCTGRWNPDNKFNLVRHSHHFSNNY